MIEPIEEYKTKDGNIVRIYQELEPVSPREWDNNGIMVCFHNNYNLGDKTDIKQSDFNGWPELCSYLVDTEKALVILPIYMYDHSGITISIKPFGCRWDSGQIGFIYTTEKRLKEMGHKEIPSDEKLLEWLEDEVMTYDKYLVGDVYAYQVIKENKCDKCQHVEEEVIDSCGGFFNIEDIKEEHEEIEDGVSKET